MAENYFTYCSIHKTFTQVRLLGTFYNAVSYIVFVQMLELNVKMCLNVSKIESVKLMSHDQQMDGHIRGMGGGVCSSVSQINSWTRLSSYCLNMQRGFWLSTAAPRKSVGPFSSQQKFWFLTPVQQCKLSQRRGNDTWNLHGCRRHFIPSSYSSHRSSLESRPTSHTRTKSCSPSPLFSEQHSVLITLRFHSNG